MKVNCAFSRRRHSQAGYVLILAAISMAVLLGFVGLAVDISYLEHVRRRMQTAADSAALAGAWELDRGGDDAAITAAALADASTNGFTQGANHISITVNHPPASGPYAGLAAVEVIINQTDQPMFFIQVVAGNRPGTVGARAVAHLGAGDGCMVALNTTDPGPALQMSGNLTFNVPNCAIIVDNPSISPKDAVKCDGNGTINVPIYSVGTANCEQATPPAVGGMLPVSDPLAHVPQPITEPFNHWTNKNPTCDAAHTNVSINSAMTLSPGVYCNGIRISTGANVTFLPGMYIMDGGGLTMTGGTALGTGLTFFLTGTAATYAPVTINGGVFGTDANPITAPTAGDYKGILFFGDRNITPKQSTYWNTINGMVDAVFNGMIYFKTGGVDLGGTGNMAGTNTAIVADTMKVAGNPGFNGDLSALPGGAPIRMAVLGE